MALYNRLEESVPSLAHFSPRLSPRLAASPLLSEDGNGEKFDLRKNSRRGQVGGDGMEIDGGGGDEMRRGRTLAQQGGEEESKHADAPCSWAATHFLSLLFHPTLSLHLSSALFFFLFSLP